MSFPAREESVTVVTNGSLRLSMPGGLVQPPGLAGRLLVTRYGGKRPTAVGMGIEPQGKDTEADCPRLGDPVSRRYKRRDGSICLLIAVGAFN